MTAARWPLTILCGAVIGVLVGMLGTSGAVTIPVLVYVFGLSQLRAQGTSLFIALIPLWIGPLLPYARAGNVDWPLGGLLAIGMSVGGYFGAQLIQTVPMAIVRKGFALVLFTVALRMFFQR